MLWPILCIQGQETQFIDKLLPQTSRSPYSPPRQPLDHPHNNRKGNAKHPKTKETGRNATSTGWLGRGLAGQHQRRHYLRRPSKYGHPEEPKGSSVYASFQGVEFRVSQKRGAPKNPLGFEFRSAKSLLVLGFAFGVSEVSGYVRLWA